MGYILSKHPTPAQAVYCHFSCPRLYWCSEPKSERHRWQKGYSCCTCGRKEVLPIPSQLQTHGWKNGNTSPAEDPQPGRNTSLAAAYILLVCMGKCGYGIAQITGHFVMGLRMLMLQNPENDFVWWMPPLCCYICKSLPFILFLAIDQPHPGHATRLAQQTPVSASLTGKGGRRV